MAAILSDPACARLASPTDIEGFRRQARALVHQGIAPMQVAWMVGEAIEAGSGPHGRARHASCGNGDLWQHADALGPKAHPATSPCASQTAIGEAREIPPTEAPSLRVPRSFASLCDEVLLHSDPGRFGLMYKLLWRLQHEPHLRHDPLDADMMLAQSMAKAVRRDIHKMRAFVRFTKVDDERHVAWFEPDHHIVEANAPFFMRRFAQMRWAILTPRRCIEWDGQRLHLHPGADRRDAPPPDAGEALWLTYYAHIFNPVRLKLQTMAREMPRRYWANLPEAALIGPLAQAAEERSRAMVTAEPSSPAHSYKPIMIQRDRRSKAEQAGQAARTVQAEEASEAALAAALDDTGSHLPTLAALRDATQVCRNCPIGAGATQAVCGEGPLRARHMIVGEQPGDQEDLAGQPFVGPAGKLLNRAMAELGWQREAAYVTNAVKHFKYELRGTRRMHKTPGQREIDACVRWLDNEIELVKPGHLVALGATAARALLGRKVSITEEHGQWLHERADGVPVLVTWHPSALLRMPGEARAEAYAKWCEDLALAQAGAS